jgi:ketosteroid isomerase-like protein
MSATQTWTSADLTADIDRMDAQAFASYFAEDGLLRFANADEVVGRDAIEQVIAGFFTTIGGLSHRVLNEWTVDDATTLQIEVTYTRLDGGQVTLPAAVIFRRNTEDLVREYRIYIDQTPLYA